MCLSVHSQNNVYINILYAYVILSIDFDYYSNCRYLFIYLQSGSTTRFNPATQFHSTPLFSSTISPDGTQFDDSISKPRTARQHPRPATTRLSVSSNSLV